MKDFTRPKGRLRSLPLAARVVYTVFLAFTLVALALTAWLADDMVGLDLAKLDTYYAGKSEHASAPVPAAPAPSDGPALDLPEEAELAPVAEPMPLRKLLEVTHFHLFSMPVYLLILSHLFMLSRMGEGAKLLWIGVGSVGTALHIAAPWIARQGDAALVYGASGVLLLLGFVVMSLVPLWEMWAPTPGAARDATA